MILLFFIKGAFLSAQDYESLYKKLDKSLQMNNSLIVIKNVDSLLLGNVLKGEMLNDFIALKVEAIVQNTFMPEALELSDELLKKSEQISERAEVRLRIQRALIFEYFEEGESAIKELDRLEEIYLKRKKDRYFGQYLYRKSSFYRVVKPVVNSDSLALSYAVKAADFGRANDYFKVSGIGKMLQGFLLKTSNLNVSIKLLKEAVRDFKLQNNSQDVCMAYLNLSKLLDKKGNKVDARRYIDSALFLSEKKKDLALKHLVYNEKYLIFEKENQIDSALFFFKKFHKAELELNLHKQGVEVSHINFKNQLDKYRLNIKKSNYKLEETEKKNELLYLFISGIFLLLIIIVFLFRRINKKKKQIDVQNKLLQKNVTQKALLLKELNHRVKNNLSLIISLIKFQSKQFDDDFNKEKFKELENRINTIAIAHEQFVYSENDVEGTFYNIEEYLQKISGPLINLSTREIDFKQTIKIFS